MKAGGTLDTKMVMTEEKIKGNETILSNFAVASKAVGIAACRCRTLPNDAQMRRMKSSLALRKTQSRARI